MPEHMRSDALFLERWALPRCRCNMLANDTLHGISAESLVAIADEERVRWDTSALRKPGAEHLHAILSEWCRPLLAAFPRAPDVSARAKRDVTTGEV